MRDKIMRNVCSPVFCFAWNFLRYNVVVCILFTFKILCSDLLVNHLLMFCWVSANGIFVCLIESFLNIICYGNNVDSYKRFFFNYCCIGIRDTSSLRPVMSAFCTLCSVTYYCTLFAMILVVLDSIYVFNCYVHRTGFFDSPLTFIIQG